MALKESADIQEQELVTFQLGKEEFGLNIMNVQEIVRMPEITKIPRAPEYVEGISNLRGNVLPVINTRHRFSMEDTELTDRTRVVVIDLNRKKIGLVVDAVNEVLRVESNVIEPPPKVIDSGIETRFLEGVVKLDKGKRLVMSLDLKTVCDIEVTEQVGDARQDVSHGQVTAETKQTIDEEQLVTFYLSGEEFGLNIQVVREIIRVPELVKTPNAPEYVMGLISLRDKLLPLVDLRLLFGQTQRSDEQDKIIKDLLNQKEEHSLWMNAVREQFSDFESDEQKQFDIPDYKIKIWLDQFQSDYELLQVEIGKLQQIASEIMVATQDCMKKPFAEAKEYVKTGFSAISNRMEELFDEAIKIIRENDEQRVVVTEVNGMEVGLMVDRVREVMRIPKSLIDPPPKLVAEGNTQAERGVAKLDDGKRLVMILDNSQLFDDDTITELADVGDAKKDSDGVVEEEMTIQQHHLEEEQLVTFKLGNEEFGIRIMQIQEINRLTDITKVPRTPEYVAGVTNLRGVVVPVINLRTRFSMENKDADDRTRVVIVDLDGKRTGLIVDQVSEVLRMLKKDIEPPPTVVSADGVNEYIDGIGKLDEGKRMLVRLDVESILSKKEINDLAKVSDKAESKAGRPVSKGSSASNRKSLKKAEEPEPST